MIERVAWRALGTSVHLLVADADPEPARVAVEDLLERVDRTYSRFRRDSELSLVAGRPGQTARVSPLLCMAISAAMRAARLTDGLVDPTVGRAMRAIGYDDDFDRVAGRTEPLTLRLERVPGWQAIAYDERARTLRVPRGIEIDLGSTGKALAADLAAAAANAATGAGVLVSLGGDIATAGEPPNAGWHVLAAEDSELPPDSDGEVVALHGGAFATSSTTVRRWTRGGVTMHHLVDPRTGLPAYSPWRTVAVIAATCVDANTAATAAIIRGESAPGWLERLGLAARLVAVDGAVRYAGSWPVPEEVAYA